MLNIVVKPCKHDTDWTVSAKTVKLGTHTAYDKRTNPIDWFSRSWVKGQGYMLHIVVKPWKHNTDCTVSARTVKLGTHTTYDKRTNPLNFQGHRSKVKVTLHIVVKLCKHDTDWTVWARTVKLGTHTTYDKRTNPIDFQGQGSKVKVTRYTLLFNLVNTIQTEPFQLGPSNLVHILLMTRGQTLLIFTVMGQRSRSHTTHCCETL